MKRQRYHPLSSFQPRVDEDGNKRCLNCDEVLTGRRRRYCSHECTRDFWAKHSWGVLRMKMLEQSDYTCAKCGFHSSKTYRSEDRSKGYPSEDFVVDHVLPISMGGAEFDEGNLQVLCVECNKKKTAEDMPRIREYLKAEGNMRLEEFLGG